MSGISPVALKPLFRKGARRVSQIDCFENCGKDWPECGYFERLNGIPLCLKEVQLSENNRKRRRKR
ncbi:MAG: hypothetical protein PWR13_1085 [Archaeoglobi archaeon]|nr:hypothetical protein [Archaeoglobi archaeon]